MHRLRLYYFFITALKPADSGAMASSSSALCALCFNAVANPAGKCLTCAESEGDGRLCSGCFEKHTLRLGRLANHNFSKVVSAAEMLLSVKSLQPAPSFCSVHPTEAIKLQCSAVVCAGALCCSLCPFTAAHKDHPMTIVADLANIARVRLVEASFEPTSGVSSASSASAGGTHSAEETPVVIAARSGVHFVSAELAVLPRNAAEARQTVESARAALHAAVSAACDTLGAQVLAATALKEETLLRERAGRENLLLQARTAAESALQVRG
jgi:hypothetical protein